MFFGKIGTFKENIGKGAFGKVYLVEDINGREFAVKESLNQKVNDAVKKELELIKKIGSKHLCPGLVQIYDAFSQGQKYYVVMEYCQEGSLFNFIKKNPNLFNEEVYNNHFTYLFI
jgi:serine/threonine protein kinase